MILMYYQQLGERKDMWLGLLKLNLLPLFRASLEDLFLAFMQV